jgi:hypothetical protein
MVDVHDRRMPALIALNPKGMHAILPHVGELHWRIGSLKRERAIG